MKQFPPPQVDGRRRDALREEAIERAKSYTPEWNPESGDVGSALLALFAEITEDVTERLDRTPEKHRIAFFDALGFSREPPQPARLPLVFQTAEGVPENVTIPSGTQTISEPEGDEPEQTFEIADGEGFEATPARLQRAYSVYRDGDAIFEHQPGAQSGSTPRLFKGENKQSHMLYFGHGDFFNLKPGTEFEVRINAQTQENVFDELQWTYYGTKEIDGEPVEKWHQLCLKPRDLDEDEDELSTEGQTVLSFTLPEGGEFVETTIPKADPAAADDETTTATESSEGKPDATVIESRWIRCEQPPEGRPEGLFGVQVTDISLSLTGLSGDFTQDNNPLKEKLEEFVDGETQQLGSLEGTTPDMLLANDVPLPPNEESKKNSSEKIFPFGEVPRPLDAFYIGSDEVFTKKGDRILMTFKEMEDGSVLGAQECEDKDPPLNRSWEYWNGTGWDYLPNLDDSFVSEGWVAFDLPEDAEGTTVAGHDGHWIRVRVLEDGYVCYEETPNNIWKMIAEVVPRFSELRLFHMNGSSANSSSQSDRQITRFTSGGSSSDEAQQIVLSDPQHVVAYNNLTYGEDEANRLVHQTEPPFSPFRRLPDETQTIYMGFDGVLDNGPIQLLFSAAEKAFPDDFFPRARWEYCENPATESWEQLNVEDGTESFTRRGIVSLVFSNPTTAFERFGRRLHWIRARLAGSQFDSVDEKVRVPSGQKIVISDVDIEKEKAVIRNIGVQTVCLDDYQLAFEDGDQIGRFRSGSAIPPGGTLTVGITKDADDSIDLILDFGDSYDTDEATDIIALQTSEGKTITYYRNDESGALPTGDLPNSETDAQSTGEDENDDEDVEANSSGPAADEPPRSSGAMEPLVLATDPTPTRSPPLLRGLYPNAGWADNVRTITDELLRSSDGTPNQTVAFANTPAIEEAVWIEELAALSEDTREELKREHPDHVEELTDESGTVTEFWVRWTAVDNFVDSTADARHYLIDRTAGMLTFGDGDRGMIPPLGDDNIRANYRTGGGVDGNVRTGSVTALTSALPFVESVINPEPASGGADAETTAETLDRAPRVLKDRNRAVTREDVERIASTASRNLARVRCIPGMDQRGKSRSGWVTVLLVPRTYEPKPVPSPEVTDRVEAALHEQAPASLTRPTPERIVVRGPSYIKVVVDTDLVIDRRSVSSVSAVEEAANSRIKAFLHPLTGGSNEEGWRFGELPCLSDFFGLLERVDGVDHVQTLKIIFHGGQTSVSVTEGDHLPEVAQDTLVFSGTHNIRAKGEEGNDDTTDGDTV
ncbi:putative baseplate assembly protein [Haladaptatus sp. NG-SE-30]